MSRTFVRFLLTGVLNTAFGYGIYALLVALGMPYIPALALATVAGVCFNFVSFGRLAFRATLGAGVFGRFIAGYGVALAFNAALLWALRERVGLNPYSAQLVCLPPTVVLTYVILNRWVYPRSSRHAH